MTRFLIIGGLVAAIAVGVVIGCGPRAKVFGKKIMDKVDKAIGELDIKMQKIEDEKNAIEKDLGKVQKSLYTSEAKLELLQGKKQKSEQLIATIKGRVQQLSDFISEAQSSADKSIDINGKTYSSKDLEQKGKDIASQFQRAQIELDGYKQRMDIYESSIKFLKEQESGATDMLADLDNKIKIIKTKRDTIESVRSDAILNADDTTLTERLAKLADEVDELDILSDVDFKIAQGDLDKINKDNTEADEIFKEAGGLDATQNMLQDILGSE